MKVYYSKEVVKFLRKSNKQDKARLSRTRKLFEKFGFQIGSRYVKKISGFGIWELRAGKIRLFLCIKGNSAYGVHIIYKKTFKLPKKDIELAERRCKRI